ncbi:hypothetical protein HQN84_08050 [Pedobacter steynii]|nr:hypothetical protein [Pedobacter steynii]NQX38798.1 hypothetical protein [Pedobacter steynii]
MDIRSLIHHQPVLSNSAAKSVNKDAAESVTMREKKGKKAYRKRVIKAYTDHVDEDKLNSLKKKIYLTSQLEMKKYYKIDNKGQQLYKETWFDKKKNVAIVHYGKVGYRGKTEEIPLDEVKTNNDFLANFCKDCKADGYYEIPQDKHAWVVVQFPLKSELGNKRDLWLKDKVQEYLKNHLGWNGLGDVDGFDMGQKKLNIFCQVVDDERAVSSIKTCLKEYHLDLNQARIATKKIGEKEYTLKFSHKKIDNFEL